MRFRWHPCLQVPINPYPPIRIHNQYMMTSAWKIVRNILNELIQRGMSNKNYKALLGNDMKIRGLYLALTHMVDLMVDMYQQRFSVLALNSGTFDSFIPDPPTNRSGSSAHYARYFKQQESNDPVDESEIIFDHNELRDAALSFIDSIIIELCFPQAPYPKFVLYQILHDAAEESPKDTKRFSQLMWDAVGDLSVSFTRRWLRSTFSDTKEGMCRTATTSRDTTAFSAGSGLEGGIFTITTRM